MGQDNKKSSVLIDKIKLSIREVIREEFQLFKEELKRELSNKSLSDPDQEHIIHNSSNDSNDSNSDWQEKYSKLHEQMNNEFKMNEDATPSNFYSDDSDEIVDENNRKHRINKNDPSYQKVMSKINKNYKNFF